MANKMLLFLSTSVLPSQSANSINVMKISEAFSNTTYDVELFARVATKADSAFCLGEVKDLYKYYAVKPTFRIKLFRISNITLYQICTVLYARLKSPHLVYTRTPIIAFLACFLGLKTILHCHGVYSGKNRIVFHLLVKHRNLKKIAVVSEGLKKVLARRYNISELNFEVISNGVDIKAYEEVIDKNEARMRVNLPIEEKIICYIGNIYEGRGIELLLELSDRLQEFYFLIVGGSAGMISNLRGKIKPNVLLVGHVSNSIVPLYLFSADLLVMPYEEEMQVLGGGMHTGDIIRPLKLFEYMAASRPIIASDLPGLREVLNYNNSVLVESNNIAKWLEAIKTILSDKQMAFTISKNARADVMEYTNEKIVRQILNY